MKIDDGTGDGFQAKVDYTNRLSTRSITVEEEVEASLLGNSYIISSGDITLTNATKNAVFFYKNKENFELEISKIVFSAGVSTGGTTNLCALYTVFDPSGLSSGSGSEVDFYNYNLGSSNTIDTTHSEKGAVGASVTGGDEIPVAYFSDKKTSYINTHYTMPKGTAIAFSVTAPASNTSLSVNVSIEAHGVMS
jgi:hypothetical protein